MKLNHDMHWPLLKVCEEQGIPFLATWERASVLYMGNEKQKCVAAMELAVQEAKA